MKQGISSEIDKKSRQIIFKTNQNKNIMNCSKNQGEIWELNIYKIIINFAFWDKTKRLKLVLANMNMKKRKTPKRN